MKRLVSTHTYRMYSILLHNYNKEVSTTRGTAPKLTFAHQMAARVEKRLSTNSAAPFWKFDPWRHLVSESKFGSGAFRSINLSDYILFS